MSGDRTYEDQFGPIARRLRRVSRTIRWSLKGTLGLRRTVLVEIRWRLGDEIMALPVYAALKRAYPNTALHVLCTYPELVADCDAVDVCNPDHVDPDCYIVLRDVARDVNRLEHYARLAGIPAPEERPRVTPPVPRASDWTAPSGKRVVVAPGATWATKRWPADRWRMLIGELEVSGCEVVVLGSGGEGVGAGRDCTGATSVTDCARILAGADVCVCSDSGLMHLALAVGTPVVALFGPTNPAILVRNDPNLEVITNERDCRFCWNDSQAMRAPGICPRDVPECLGTIEAGTVARRVHEVLARRF